MISPVILSARVFALLSLATAAFQLALVVGAPWGHLTMGGQFPGALPPAARALAAFSMCLLLAFAWIVARRAQLADPTTAPRLRRAAWLVVTYCALGIVANAATPSAPERALWLPVVLAMFATSVVVARSSGHSDERRSDG